MIQHTLTLTELPNKTTARIVSIQCQDSLRQRFYALGIYEDLPVRIVHEGPIKADPIAIDLDGHLVALRRADAAHIHVAFAEHG
jgi:Fe2+ transport system protein FeoA